MNQTEAALEKSAAHHVEDLLGAGAIFEARQATADEHEQSLWQALRANRKAVLWSVLVSMSIIMEGYDTILMGNFFAYPRFREKYGEYTGEEHGWQVSAPWQTGLSMASTVGCIFGEWEQCFWCIVSIYRKELVAHALFFHHRWASQRLLCQQGRLS